MCPSTLPRGNYGGPCKAVDDELCAVLTYFRRSILSVAHKLGAQTRPEEIWRDARQEQSLQQHPLWSLTQGVWIMPNIFIYHGSEDENAIVTHLANDLRSLGLDVWYDAWEIKPGDSLRARIVSGLEPCDYPPSIGAVALCSGRGAGSWLGCATGGFS